MSQGGCLCGAVRFEAMGTFRNSRQRKAQRSAYTTKGIMASGDFSLVAGRKD